MGILSNKRGNENSNGTKSFYFGAPEAEGENIDGYKLTDYFEDYLDILGDLEKGKFIFVGRKGVGKSAIAKFIKEKSEESSKSFATILRISDVSLEGLIQENEDKEQLIFEWLALINLVKLIVNNECGQYTQEYDKLKKFLERNLGSVAIDKFQVDERLLKQGGEINFSVLTHVFGGIFKKYFDIKTTKAPFYKLIPPLKEVVKIILDFPVNKENEFWLLFDDLDVNFDLGNESHNQKIINLLRLAKHYNNDIFKENGAKILVFIRDDIRSYIESKYNDSAKIIHSYEIFINWYSQFSSSIDENNIPLKRLANRRIEINFKKHKISIQGDPWYNLFTSEIGHKSSFKYILDFTFYRPRDIVTFLSAVSSENYSYPISPSNLNKILNVYIKKNLAEIKSELSLYFNETEKDKIFKNLLPFVRDHNSIKLKAVIEKADELDFESGKNVVEILFNYSLLIYKNKFGELFFNYREFHIDNLDVDELSVTLPKCLYHYYRPLPTN
ncbi:MAG: P-loop ATPase, Sll1717 family [Bacteroidota bacterium]